MLMWMHGAFGLRAFLPMRYDQPRSRICIAVTICAVAALVLGGCSLPPILVERIVTPTPVLPTAVTAGQNRTAWPTPTVAPSPTASPSPTPTATPTSTPDPAELEATAEAGLAHVRELSADVAVGTGRRNRVLCLRYEDVDTDGAPEWIALVHQEDGRQNGLASRLSAFVLDEAVYHALEPVPPKTGTADVGFGQYATCDIVVRDINADGIVEIAIFGHADGNQTLLHVFAWDGAGYRRLGFFSGDAGVKLVSVDGDLEEEIWEGHRIQGAPSLAWHIVHTWESGSYGWTSEHYDWYYADRPQSYPTHGPDYAVIAFYLALNVRDLPGAYNLLSSQTRAGYETWALGYATTLRVNAGSAHTIPAASGEDRARVATMVTAWDNEGGVVVGRLWNVEWDTIRTGEGWRLLTPTSELLEEWTVSYWP